MQRQYAREKQDTKNSIFNHLYALFGHKDSVFWRNSKILLKKFCRMRGKMYLCSGITIIRIKANGHSK